jgi:hypothetical protein
MRHLYCAADIIQSNALAEKGVDLFVATIPPDVHRGVMLRDPLIGAELDKGMDGYTHHEFQIIVRDKDPEISWSRALTISRALDVQNYTGHGAFIRFMYPLSLPANYPRMDSDELETSVRMRVCFVLL